MDISLESEIKLGLLKIDYILELRLRQPGVEYKNLNNLSLEEMDRVIAMYAVGVREETLEIMFGSPEPRSPSGKPLDLSPLKLSPLRDEYDATLQSAVEFDDNLNALFETIRDEDREAADRMERELERAWRERYAGEEPGVEQWSFEPRRMRGVSDVLTTEPDGYSAEYEDDVADSDVDMDVDDMDLCCANEICLHHSGIQLRF